MLHYTIFLLAFIAAASLTTASNLPSLSWIRTETLRNERGQPSYNFSDSISSLGNLLAIGSASSNKGRGQVSIYFDGGGGLKQIATIPNVPQGIIGDGFGSAVLLFNYNGFKQVAVAAPLTLGGSGCVYIFQQNVNNASTWDYILQLSAPTGTYVTNFGRTLAYDGTQLLISAESVYKSGARFRVTAINVVGTSTYIQSDGIEATIPGDPILVFRSVADRNNKTYLQYHSQISDADYTLNTGASISISGNYMAVGASFRQQLKYGSGTDGDLDVTGVTYLDGTASYNFENIIVRAGGVLTVDHFDAIRGAGGIMSVKVKNLLYIEKGGLINLTAAGYKGGPTAFILTGNPQNGAFLGGGKAATSKFVGVYACDYSTTVAVSVALSAASTNRLSINQSLPFAQPCGGGGGYGTKGAAGTKVGCGDSGAGGSTYGDPSLTVLYRGSGGGAGMPWQVGAGGAGGDGGGVVDIAARQIINYGRIEANGGPGSDGGFFSGAGGGGSGGSIRLVGDNLANYGSIRAVGGAGGVRASGSGSGGDTNVRGGNGGSGRIKFDFLQTQAHGLVLPRPINVTSYLGDVLLYKKNLTTRVWELVTYLPRQPEFQFIGHQVALSGTTLAVASTQGTPVTPTEQVFLLDISTIVNDSSPYTFTTITSPNRELQRCFGCVLQFVNRTLIIGARGDTNTKGAMYVYQSRDTIHDRGTPVVLHSKHPLNGDYFGNTFVLDFPRLYIQLPLSQDETLATNVARSTGSVIVYKYARNVSVAHSFVTCNYTTVTPNVTLNCTVHLRSSDNYVAGDIVDIQYITPAVDFQSIGVFTFQLVLHSSGLIPVNVTYLHHPLTSVSITVTEPILPNATSLSCTNMTPSAGDAVICNITTNAGSGEEIAAKEFDVFVWNLDDYLLFPHGFEETTSFGQVYRVPPSGFVSVMPNTSDYHTVAAAVRFVSQRHYSFTVTPWRPGTYGVIGLYQNVPLAYPNPVILTVSAAEVNTTLSVVTCPAVAAPNRTLTCVLQLFSSPGVPTSIAGLTSLLPLTNTTVAGYNTTTTASSYPVAAVDNLEGRYSIMVVPNATGFFFVNVTLQGVNIRLVPASGVNITDHYPVSCRTFPRMKNSFSVFSQAAQARGDVGIYGVSATDAAYSNGVGFCDDPKV